MLGLVALSEQLRPNAQTTIEHLHSQHVQLGGPAARRLPRRGPPVFG